MGRIARDLKRSRQRPEVFNVGRIDRIRATLKRQMAGSAERGATLVEYALITSVFVLVASLAATQLRDSSGDFLAETGEQMASPAELQFDGDANGGESITPAAPYPWETDPVDLRGLATASSSSNWPGLGPANAIDQPGGTSTLFATANGDRKPRITFAMSETVSFDSVRIHNRYGCCQSRFRDLLIVVSDSAPTATDPSSLIGTAKTIFLPGYQGAPWVDVPLNSWTGNYISVYRIDQGGSGTPYLQIPEFEVSGWRQNDL